MLYNALEFCSRYSFDEKKHPSWLTKVHESLTKY